MSLRARTNGWFEQRFPVAGIRAAGEAGLRAIHLNSGDLRRLLERGKRHVL